MSRNFKRTDSAEIVAIGIPVLCEAVVVILFISMIAVWAAIGAGA